MTISTLIESHRNLMISLIQEDNLHIYVYISMYVYIQVCMRALGVRVKYDVCILNLVHTREARCPFKILCLIIVSFETCSRCFGQMACANLDEYTPPIGKCSQENEPDTPACVFPHVTYAITERHEFIMTKTLISSLSIPLTPDPIPSRTDSTTRSHVGTPFMATSHPK